MDSNSSVDIGGSLMPKTTQQNAACEQRFDFARPDDLKAWLDTNAVPPWVDLLGE
jgi:hypothetical protein